MKPARYRPLPDDWIIGFSDVIGSTKAIAEGRYKAVNMVGAGVIAAVSNALKRKHFPFVFGGDGASFAVSAGDAPAASEALKAMAAFAREELQIGLRVAMVPAIAVRAAGRDIRVGRFAASPHCTYAMFVGGGLAWVEMEAKRGVYQLEPAQPGSRPDLSDLSCRWSVAPAANGTILSLIVAPRGEADARFVTLVEEVVEMAMNAKDGGRPITLSSLHMPWPKQGIELEAAWAPPGLARLFRRFRAAYNVWGARITTTLKIRAGKFNAVEYVNDVVANSDFRKFDDGLRMTLDCSEEFAEALERRLQQASDFAEYGAFRQSNALLTCYAPSLTDRTHVHFVDGAGGGYAMAAKAMKERRAPKAVAA
jgi:hypothetical protein